MNDSIPLASADRQLLMQLSPRIPDSELEILGAAPGFQEPNDFPFENLRRVLRDARLPEGDHYEYVWAIYESAWEIEHLPAHVRLFISMLYVFCNKQHRWAIEVDGAYYLAGASACHELADDELTEAWRNFLEFLNQRVRADEGFDPYHLELAELLTLSLLKRRAPEGEASILNRLLARGLSSQDIREKSVVPDLPERWLALYQRINASRAPTSPEVLRAIMGS